MSLLKLFEISVSLIRQRNKHSDHCCEIISDSELSSLASNFDKQQQIRRMRCENKAITIGMLKQGIKFPNVSLSKALESWAQWVALRTWPVY